MKVRPELQGEDPIQLLTTWLQEAGQHEPNDSNAAALATATPDGFPSVRMVLIKQISREGLCFYTNAESQKGQELKANPRAAVCLHWKSLRRQVRAVGSISLLPDAISDQYFHSRSRRSQIGAAVSHQSHVLASRAELEAEVADFTWAHEGREIPRPAFWRGYLLQPDRVEFWIDGADRLHDRRVFSRNGEGWTSSLLYP